ncbi:hypothetical protein [Arthrobacter sp. B1805]|uniref:PH-like domain-containing protein n=1 Tax=Arthrobacter sp. B1805 TaxID=2058892 RepID=UPI002157775E|nr:hypothetical protein [Arthrobacter sp. B1805]
MDYLGWVALTLGIIVVIIALMALGWRNRLRRQGHVPEPVAPPADPGAVLYEAEGQYVATTTAGDWLDRIAVHGLGLRGNAVAVVHAGGIVFRRTGERDVYIPRSDLVSVQLAGGMTGKFVEKEGLVVITWLLGTERVDTGFRTRHAAHKAQLVAAVAALVPADASHQPNDTTHHRTPPTPEGREHP